MISSLKLQFGRAPHVPAEPFPLTPVTVFVGPNNSGKSKILTEILQYCSSGNTVVGTVILDSLSFSGVPQEQLELTVTRSQLAPVLGQAAQPGTILVGKGGDRMQIDSTSFRKILLNPEENPPAFSQYFLRFHTLMLDGRNRINLVGAQAAGDLQQLPQTSLQVLFRDDTKRHQVRRIIFEAFGSYFVVDPTNLGQLRIRLSECPPASDLEERGIHDAAIHFHAQAQTIETTSDGVKAFTGIITEVFAGDPKVLLIDEPEAFLHPALAFKLGAEIARASLGSNKRLFVSTHSPSFVMGCIQSGAPVNIVRLTYRGGIATARHLPSGDILRLMRNPLLRSTGVLTGLFYEFVIVTESDADRAFYQEINERLLRFKPGWGIPNALFLNAQNKQTVHTILAPLRELGIPAAGIVDVDVVKDGGSTWTSLLAGANVPQLNHQPLGSLRAGVKQALEGSGKNMKRDGGTAVLSGQARNAAEDLFDQLADYGVFVVRGGELESWLPELGVGGHGPGWLIEVFERMGEDSDAEEFLRPGEGDVWAFIYGIRAWLTNPMRKGIPV